MKVWIVYEIAVDCPGEYPTMCQSVCGVFDSEEKAVNCIRECVKRDHEVMENCELNFDRSQYVRLELDQQMIVEGMEIGSYQYYDEDVSYIYRSHEVK